MQFAGKRICKVFVVVKLEGEGKLGDLGVGGG